MISKSQSLKRKKSSERQRHDGSHKKTKDEEWERRMEGFRGLDLVEGPPSADIEWEVSEEESDADFNHGEIEIEASKSESEDDCDISHTATSQKQPITDAQSCSIALDKLSSSSSQEIDSTSQSPPSQSFVHRKTTPSAWLKNLQWKPTSPEKSWQYNEEELDSAKKKKLKFSREGLAERLRKLTAREKSSKRFWAHSLTTSSSKEEEEEGVLRVQIMGARNYHSLLWTTCSNLTTVHSQQLGSQLGSQFSVVFNTQQDIRVGSIVKIHPPWKKINLPSGTLILCSRFRQTVCTSTAASIGIPLEDISTDSQ